MADGDNAGTNYTGENPSYPVEFLVTSNDGLASATVTPSGNGTLSDLVVTDNGDGTYTLSAYYTQGASQNHDLGGV